MNIKLSYNIDEYEEGHKLYQLANATGMAQVIHDMDQELRGLVKYDDGSTDEAVIKAYEDIRETLHHSCDQEGFFIDKLWE